MITVRPDNLSFKEIKAIPLAKPPGTGAYWHGVNHRTAIDTLLTQVKRRGWRIIRKTATVSHDKADLIIDLEIEMASLQIEDGNGLALALLTSNAQRRGTRMMLGINVAATKKDRQGYGIVIADVTRKAKKHTTPEFEPTIRFLLNNFRHKLDTLPYQIEQLSRQQLSLEEAQQLLMSAGERRILVWSRIGKVLQDISASCLRSNKEEITSLSLYEAFCKIVRLSPPMQQLDQMNNFRKTLPLY